MTFGFGMPILDHFGLLWPLWPKTPRVISQPEMIPDSKAWFYFKYTIEKLASMDRFWLWGAFFGRGIRKCLFEAKIGHFKPSLAGFLYTGDIRFGYERYPTKPNP